MMQLALFFAAFIALGEASARPQSKGKGKGGGDLIGGLLKGMGGSVPNGPAPGGCSKYEIIVARGTGEPGPFGSVVGDKLVRTVTRQLPGSRGYAVQYPANMNMTVSGPQGVKDTTDRLNRQIKACPDQKFAIVGYSQGAGVMHAAAAKFDAAVISKVVAAVMFGDPGFKSATPRNPFPAPIQARLMENCNPGDPVCDPSGGEFSGHLQYSKASYQDSSARFIVAAFKGQPLPKVITSAVDPNWPGYGKSRPAAKGKSSPAKGQPSPAMAPKRFSILAEREAKA